VYFDIKQLLADREKDGSKGLYIPGVNALDNSSHCYYEWLLINLEKKVRTIKRKREISPYILIEDWGKKKITCALYSKQRLITNTFEFSKKEVECSFACLQIRCK